MGLPPMLPTQRLGRPELPTTGWRRWREEHVVPVPGWETSTDYPFGTDGGVGNFLRFLEDWKTESTLNYGGSLVSLYYSTYNTGIFKCCTYSVYQPPNRG